MCKDCEYWLGFNLNHSYTGCSLGLTAFEISQYYLENELVKRETGLDRGCYLFNERRLS